MRRNTFLLAFILLPLAACKSHACPDDREAEAPAKLSDAPLVQDGGRMCFSDAGTGTMGSITVAYWGDEMDDLALLYRAGFEAAGWAEGCPYETQNEYCFRKEDRAVSLTLSQTESPRLGAKLSAPSIHVAVSWYSGLDPR
jgi:hypothetical protein